MREFTKCDLDFSKDENVLKVYDCAMEYFGHRIYVPCKEGHPCGWDFIEFEYIDRDDILEYKFESNDISNGCGSDEFEDKTLKEILIMVDGYFEMEF